MVRRHAGFVLEGLDRIFNWGTVAGLSEGDLLKQFVARADEMAFAALVSRHGPMVLGVCRRALRDEHDVEDAFQATFLVLVRRAGSIRDGERVGHWLHGVAHRVAVRARANAARRHLHEQTGIKVVSAEDHSPPLDDVAVILDDELVRLPESLRAPVVLCYLEGLTHDEAAQRLGWPVGTVRSRMSRARELLQRRLTRRGISAPGMATFPSLAAQHVSTALINATVRFAQGIATEKTAAGILAQGVLTAMMISKLKLSCAAIVVGVAMLGGVQTLAQRVGTTKPVDAPALTSEVVKDQLTQDLAKTVEEETALKAKLAEVRERKRTLQVQLAKVGDSVRSEANSVPAKGAAVSLETRPIPNYMRWGDLILVTSPGGDKVSLYYSKTRQSKAVRLFESGEPAHQVTPIFNEQAVALSILGPKIGRVAVFNYTDSTWHSQELREPVVAAQPVIGTQIITYSLGRFVYAFSTAAKQWDVLELPVAATPLAIVGPSGATVEHDGHIYDFHAQTGKWIDLDVRTILDAPETTK